MTKEKLLGLLLLGLFLAVSEHRAKAPAEWLPTMGGAEGPTCEVD